jgi:hypothetical protein
MEEVMALVEHPTIQSTGRDRYKTDKMSALSLRLPSSIHQHIREIAQNEGVSINQFVSSAVSEKIFAIMTEDYLKSRAKKVKNPT